MRRAYHSASTTGGRPNTNPLTISGIARRLVGRRGRFEPDTSQGSGVVLFEESSPIHSQSAELYG